MTRREYLCHSFSSFANIDVDKVHHGPSLLTSTLPPQLSTDPYFEPIYVYLGRGIYLSKKKIHITFDSYAQDV